MGFESEIIDGNEFLLRVEKPVREEIKAHECVCLLIKEPRITDPDVIKVMHDGKWFQASAKNGFDPSPRRKVQLAIRIEVPVGGWTPADNSYFRQYGYTTTTASNATITLTNTIVSGSQPSKGKTVREHHINRETLLGVVRENQEKYAAAYTRFKALYADEVESLTQKHLDGLIPTNQIVVKDKDNNAITILTDMSKTFDDQLRELELDDREVVVLDHEEYGLFVEGYATNLKQVEETAKKLEELQ